MPEEQCQKESLGACMVKRDVVSQRGRPQHSARQYMCPSRRHAKNVFSFSCAFAGKSKKRAAKTCLPPKSAKKHAASLLPQKAPMPQNAKVHAHEKLCMHMGEEAFCLCFVYAFSDSSDYYEDR